MITDNQGYEHVKVDDLTISTGDLEIGAVEIKNSTDDTRATVGANGLSVDVKAIAAGITSIGFATVVNTTGTAYIGCASVNVGGIAAGINSIGFATVSVGAGISNIGFATVTGIVSANIAGTTKTLASLPIAMSAGSVATIAVPTNANRMYITNLLLSSNATARINILSHDVYLMGNASCGVTLNPGSGWVETGSPDSPTYIGNPSGAIVIQKFDMTATAANITGKVVYYQE
jgi:hypothetical protein